MALRVSGADLMDGTPIYDIKPYLAYTDSHPDATGGFADEKLKDFLEVDFSPELLKIIPESKQTALLELLSEDPRPHYINDSERIYGFKFADFEIKFKVKKLRKPEKSSTISCWPERQMRSLEGVFSSWISS